MPNGCEPICFFEAGLIAGCLESILSKKVKVTETKCYTMGHGCCEFEVTIVSDPDVDENNNYHADEQILDM